MSKQIRSYMILSCAVLLIMLPSAFLGSSIHGQTDGTIYFSKFYDLVDHFYSIDTDGNNLHFLIQSTRGSFSPSPDGNRIALPLHRGGPIDEGEYDLYLMEFTQENLIQLTQTGSSHSQIWSPSGDYITFVVEEANESTIISIPMEETTSLTPLISSTDLSGDIVWLGHLEWSSDERFLLFEACHDNFVCDVYSVDADGTGLRNLTEEFVGSVSDSALSPDAQSLALAANDRDSNLTNSDIYILDMANGVFTKITDTSAEYLYLNSNPTGDWLAYTSNRDGDWDIYLTNFDTMSSINLTQNSNRQDGFYGFDWSPDGSQIVYAAGPIEGNSELFIIDIEGSTPIQLTDNDYHDVWPIWLD